MLAIGVMAAGCRPSQQPLCSGAPDMDRCFAEAAFAVYPSDPEFRQLMGSITSPAERDLVRSRLVVQDPTRAAALCSRMETQRASAMCNSTMSRPHLR